MTRFVLRRIALTVPILLGVSVVVFVTIRLIPGDPVASLLGPTSTPETRARLTEQLGLDDPLPLQYATWLWDLLRGDAGLSIANQSPAMPYVWNAFVNTLKLAAFSAVFAIIGGISLGLIAAIRRGRVASAITNVISLLAVSIPQYSIALLFIVYLAAGLGWFPTGGMSDSSGGGGFADLLHHLWLPGVSAGLVSLGLIARMVRSAYLDQSSADFVEGLKARGLSEWRVRWHTFHNIVPSVLTIIGLQVGYLLSGVIFVEIIFSWPGLGLAVYQAISQRDQAVIQAGVLISALAFVLVNLMVDTMQGLIDPRVRR